jgi:hypothetical protein
MKMQWQIYQALELIPDAVQCPRASVWKRWLAPLRRSLANTFVRELSQRHQILLFKRCLDLESHEFPLQSRTGIEKVNQQCEVISPPRVAPDETGSSLPMQQWLEPGGVPWWAWEDM